MKHLITLRDLSISEIRDLIQRSIAIKANVKSLQKSLITNTPLTGKTLSLIFSKASTRTRVSAETGWAFYGGQSLFLGKNDIQLGTGEPIQDTARVVSSMSDAIMARLGPHEDIEVRSFNLGLIFVIGSRQTFIRSRHQCPH